MLKIILKLLFVVLIISCNAKKDSYFDNSIVEIEPGLYTYKNVFVDKDKKVYFYFLQSDSIINILDTNSNFVKSINISKVYKFKKHISNVVPVLWSLDTVLITSSIYIEPEFRYDDYLFIIDENGIIKKNINLSLLGEKHCTFRPDGKFIDINDTCIFLSPLAPRQNADSYEKRLIKYFSHCYYSESICEILNVFNDSIVVNHKIKAFPLLLSEYNNEYLPLGGSVNIYKINNNYFLFSYFSDKLLMIDVKSNQIKKTIIVNSKYTNIGFKLDKIKNNISYQEQLNHNISTKGLILGIYFNSTNDRYYVPVCIEEDEKIINQKGYRSWSIIVYDSDFNKIDEILFNKNRYSFYFYQVNGGMLIQKNPEVKVKNKKYEKLFFQKFNY